MHKEIERKWLFKSTSDINKLEIKDSHIIKDFYFNSFTRLRNKDGAWFITIKSMGKLIRDEFEFRVDKNDINFIPAPMLIKYRYLVQFNDKVFEINKYKDIYRNTPFGTSQLIIVECELQSEDEQITLPEWVDEEITDVTSLYNYNLFNMLKNSVL